MLTKSARPTAQRMAPLLARAWATLGVSAIPFSALPDSGLLELIRVANERHLPDVLMGAATELARRLGHRVEPDPDDDFIALRAADRETRLARLEETAARENG